MKIFFFWHFVTSRILFSFSEASTGVEIILTLCHIDVSPLQCTVVLLLQCCVIPFITVLSLGRFFSCLILYWGFASLTHYHSTFCRISKLYLCPADCFCSRSIDQYVLDICCLVSQFNVAFLILLSFLLHPHVFLIIPNWNSYDTCFCFLTAVIVADSWKNEIYHVKNVPIDLQKETIIFQVSLAMGVKSMNNWVIASLGCVLVCIDGTELNLFKSV